MKKYIFVFTYLIFVQSLFGQNLQPYVFDIKLYLDDNEVIGPVYKNVFEPRVIGIDNTVSYINLVNIFHLLESEIVINGNIIVINNLKIGNIKIIYENQTNIIIIKNNNIEFAPPVSNNTIVIINNEYYITINTVRYLINGALLQDEKKVSLYTFDYMGKLLFGY